MKNIGLFKAIMLCIKYNKMSETEKRKTRDERFHQLVTYTKQHSPYYQRLYKNIGDTFELTDLPPTNKRELMAHFDDWMTDRSIKQSNVHEFMEDLDHIGRKFRGKYLVLTTSGSTGDPLVMLNDKTTTNVMGGITTTRSFARKKDFRAFIKAGARSMGVFATGGFYLGNSTVRSRLIKRPWKKKQFGVISALLPIEEIVKELNTFQPVMLGGYPTILELLIDEEKSGRLNISPVIIITGGEYLSDELREKLAEAFQCYVQTNYSCTEGGAIACECMEQHFHINEDWVIVEPVDKENNPVPYGVQSDKILLTNLFNYTQPFIRYEITDRVVMHDEPCACGNPAPWLTLEGRTDDTITFVQNRKEIKIPPLALSSVLDKVSEIQRFQVVAYDDNNLEIRIRPSDGYSKEDGFAAALHVLKNFLAIHGVDEVKFLLSEEEPKQHPKSGKFKHIVNAINKSMDY